MVRYVVRLSLFMQFSMALFSWNFVTNAAVIPSLSLACSLFVKICCLFVYYTGPYLPGVINGMLGLQHQILLWEYWVALPELSY